MFEQVFPLSIDHLWSSTWEGHDFGTGNPSEHMIYFLESLSLGEAGSVIKAVFKNRVSVSASIAILVCDPFPA